MEFDEERLMMQETLCSSLIIAIGRFSSKLPYVIDSSCGQSLQAGGHQFEPGHVHQISPVLSLAESTSAIPATYS
jgi:hypothetical protein